jgi:uncharacterized membrane protein (DUF485 family)
LFRLVVLVVLADRVVLAETTIAVVVAVAVLVPEAVVADVGRRRANTLRNR